MPEVSQVHIDAALGNVSVAYRNPAFVADVLAPPLLVRKQSDRYFIHDPGREAFRPTADLRAPGAEAAEVDFALSNDSYFCDDHALESTIPDEERENADPVLSPDIDRTEFLTDKIELNREVALAELFAGAATPFGATALGAGERWDEETGDPLGQLATLRATITAAVQHEPNALLLSADAYHALRRHPDVTALAGSASPGLPNTQQLANILDLERVVVARGWQNTARPGQAPAMAPIWSRVAVLFHAPGRPGMKTVAPAYTFLWATAPGSIDGRVVEKWREPRRKADMIRVQKYYDHKVVAAGAAHVLKTVVG